MLNKNIMCYYRKVGVFLNTRNTKFTSIKKALKEAGFRVDAVVNYDRKTVITVFRCDTRREAACNAQNMNHQK